MVSFITIKKLKKSSTYIATIGTISDVDAFTEYSCTIRAVTVADGPASSTVVVTTLQACMTADHALMFCFTVCVNVHSFHSSNY